LGSIFSFKGVVVLSAKLRIVTQHLHSHYGSS
jgi:hypothetical protein